MRKAEEVFLIVRELSHASHGEFRWKLWHDACVAVMGPSKFQLKRCFKSTVGNSLRSQVKNGTLERVKRGVYRIRPYVDLFGHSWARQGARRPLYVTPGRYNMTPGESCGRVTT